MVPEPPREEYRAGQLDEAEVGDDPLVVLAAWLTEAVERQLPEPTAATVATVDAGGVPDARVVLLRGVDRDGVVWFTNHRSAKGRQLEHRPVAAVVGWWPALERQYRLRGPVEQLPAAESDAYFASRPRGSQLGAWASEQSSVIDGRDGLERAVAEVTDRFAGREVPRPPHWGGYRLRPTTVELWQGRPSRLHDRLRWSRADETTPWHRERLQP